MKKFKKTLAMLLSIIMVFGIMPASVFTASAEEASTCPIEGATGTGTEADPYIVDTYEELKTAVADDKHYSTDVIYIVANGYIECLDTITIEEKANLTVNGVIHCDKTVFLNGESTTFQGNGQIISDNGDCLIAAGVNGLTINGELVFSAGQHAINTNYSTFRSTLVINGGTFKSTSDSGYSLYNSGKSRITSGSFENGIYMPISLDGCIFYKYEDGTVSKELKIGEPVEVVDYRSYLGFENQMPAMPEGETEIDLGTYDVGDPDANITFFYTEKDLPQELIISGYTTKSSMQVFSSKNGDELGSFGSSDSFIIDNETPARYTIIQEIELLNNKNQLEGKYRNVFYITIGGDSDIDPNSPIEGAIGTGTEKDPVVVNTFSELKNALEYPEPLYILVNDHILCSETLSPETNKTLTVNGTLYNFDNVVFEVWNTGFVLQGKGKIKSDESSCVWNYSNDMVIAGELTFNSQSDMYSTINANAGNLTIYGGVVETGGTSKYFYDLDVYKDASVVVYECNFSSKGINGEVVLADGSFYVYEDGSTSTKLTNGEPVEVYALGFATQYPAMPEGETAKELGIREIGKNGILTVKFTPESLPQASIDAGYTIKEDLKIYDPTGKIIKSQASGASCQVVPEIEGVYIIIETLTLIDPDGNQISTLTNTFTFTAENRYSVFGRISGVPEGKPITINLYKAGEDTPFKTTTAYGQGDFDINNLPLDVAFEIEGVPNGDYVLEAKCNNYVTYRYSFTIKDKNFTDLIFMEPYKTVVVDITGMYSTDTATVKIYEKGTDTVVHTAKIKGNGSHIFPEVANGNYTVEVSATGYKTKTTNLNIYDSDTVKGVAVEMELDASNIDFGFATQSPEPTAGEITDGHTDLGLMSTLPTFSFTAKQLYFKYMDMGYSIKTQTQVEYSSGGMKSFDSTTWTCGNYDYGTNKVTQIVMLIDPDGNEVARKTHTYTFTYAKLYFESRTPSVTSDQAAAGFSDLGALTSAPKFAFTAASLPSALREEGYSQSVRMEAYQGDKLVYNADNGNTYIHIYPGEGTVFQTIYLLNADGEVVDSISHAYTFTVEFPEGTIALDADFLTLAENSTHQLSATFAPESLAETLVWTSSNSAVATIDSNGIITAVRPGSALIKATLGNGATAYCAVLVTADDVKAYVGGIGLREGEYLVQGSSIPTTTKPNGNYAYLSTVNGTLTLELHNYHYAGMGTFTSKNTAYGIYSTSALKIVAGGRNTIGPMSAPVDRYTSYGIGKGETVSITSNANGVLNIKGVNTAISSSRYVFVSGNLNITDVTSGISATHAQAMGGINFESGNVNIDCTGTAISATGNYINFSGADVTINCKAGINLVRQGEITIDSGSLKLYAATSGINVKSGLAMTVNGGTAYIEAVNNAIALEGDLYINGGSIVLISTDTASDDSYSAISGAGTLTLASGISSVASTGTTYSTSSIYADSRRSTFDYVSFRGGSDYTFVKQPVGGDVKGGGTMTITWETGFKPTKLELITFDGSSSTVTTLNSYSNYADFGVLPEGGYYQLRAYYATNYSITSDKFYVYSTAHTVTFDSGVASQEVADGALAVKPSDPTKDNKFFYGWLTPDGKVFDFSTPITEDITLTAGWTDIKVNGVAMPDGTYLGLYSGAVTTGRPSDHWAYYKDGVLTLYNFDSPYGSGIEFGDIDLTVVSSGNGNAVSNITSYYDYANLTIDGTATLNVGHEQWMDYAILVYNTITFKCDTIVECLDYTAIADAEEIIVDGAEVKVYAYCDMYFSNTIYGCEAPITVLSGSLYLYCEGDGTNTDSYIANPDKVLVYASDRTDGTLTDDKITNRGDEPYELDLYRQIWITPYNTVKFHIDGYAVLMKKVATGACIEKPLDSDYGNRVFLGWCTEDGQYYDFNTPVTQAINLYAKFSAVEPEKGDFDFDNNIISGILPGTTNLDDYCTLTPGYEWSYQTQNGYLGTGTVADVVNGDEIEESFVILLYGDVNGDGWYDGMDAVLVNCIVNGMLTEADLGELAFKAADCNHDGVIDETDVALLNQAGTLLANVDQSKPTEILLETSADYVEYLSLIDQSFDVETEDENDIETGTDVEADINTTPEQDANIETNFFEMIMNLIKSIFEMLLECISVPLNN